jgi:hypothetical protein
MGGQVRMKPWHREKRDASYWIMSPSCAAARSRKMRRVRVKARGGMEEGIVAWMKAFCTFTTKYQQKKLITTHM